MKKYEFCFSKKALLSILLIFCMLFGSMPAAASEVSSEETTSTVTENEVEPTIIDSVSVYELEKPAAGNNPDFRVTVSAGDDYTIDFSYGLGGVVWTDISDGKELSSNDMFETGKRYRADIYVKAYEDCAFKTSNGQPAADADIDGRIADVKALPTVSADKLIIVSGTYSIADPDTTISDVEAIDLNMPVFGATPDFDVTVPANANFTVDSVKWTKDVSTENEYLTKELTENDTFDAGDYAVTVTFRANNDYKFRANANGVITGRLNGEVAMPACSITDDGEYDTYSICLMPSVEEPVSQNIAISDVEASGITMPVFGETPDFDAVVPENANYTVDNIKWTKDVSTESEYLTKELTANDTFDAGDYAVTVTFRANNGYKFRANANGVITGRLNGEVAMPMSSITNDGEYDTYAICLMPSVEEPESQYTAISDVEASGVTMPVFGETPDFDAVVPENANYTVDSIKWTKDVSTESEYLTKELTENDTFDAGDYAVTVTFRANNGYKFKANADGVITGRLNGEVAMPMSSITNDGEYDTYSICLMPSVEEPVSQYTAISDVEAIDLDMPVFGATPDFDVTVPANANFTVDSVKWVKDVSTESEYLTKELTENDTFDAGEYIVTVTFRAKDGCKFKANEFGAITGRLNGNVAMPATSITNDGEYDTYSICLMPSVEEPVSQNIVISDVEASGITMPVFGEKPDFDAVVPENANYTVDNIKWTKDVSTESEYLTKELTENDTFDAGDYAVTVTFRVKDGYKFKANADGVITGRLNGEVAMPMSSITNDGEYDTYSICLMPSVEEPEEETEYEMLEGMNGKWIREKGKKLRFRASGDFEKFVRVLVDGAVVDRKHYVASSGSTIIEFNESYLDSLANGEHELTVEFTDGEVNTNFYVEAPKNNNSEVPKTGDSDNIGAHVALMFISFCGMISLAVYDRKKEKERI